MSGETAVTPVSRRPFWVPPYWVWVALILAFGTWLRWPTLYNGFFSDDLVADAMADGEYAAPRGKLDLFNFTDGTPEDYKLLTRVGSLPWWTVPGLRLAMLRPLSSALILLDRALFGDNAFLYHIHSLLWWLGAMVMAAVLLRDLFSAPLAGCALTFFAVEQGHTLPLGWLANRGTLVAIVFCLGGLRAQLRYRAEHSLGAAWLAFACFSIALLSGEWAFPLLGYALGYALVADRAPWRERLLALWTAAIPGVLFLGARAVMRYGALNSGVYTDPLTEPGRFAYMALHRIPVFIADLVFAIPASWWGYNTPWRDLVLSWELVPPHIWLQLPGWHTWHVVLGLTAIVVMYYAVRFGLRDRPETERRSLHWLLAGGAISLIPVVSSFPTSRLVIPAALAVGAAAAALLLAAVTKLLALSRIAGWRWVFLARPTRGSALVCVLGIAAIVYFQFWRPSERSYGEANWTSGSYEAIRWFGREVEFDDTRIANQTVVILSAVDHSSTIFLPYLRRMLGHPMPHASLTLTAAPQAHDVYRPSANVLELTTLGGTFLSSEFEELYRAPRFKMREGELIDIGPMKVQIVRLIDGKPQIVRFTFEKNVDDPSYVFLYATVEGYVRVALPEIGERKRFRRAGWPSDVHLHEAVRAGRDPNITCLGLQPPLDECRLGLFFADCGGEGPPVLACRFNNDCRWFLHRCVAEEYEPSSCVPDNPCCIRNSQRGSRGTWPFPAESFMSDAGFAAALSEDLQGWGRAGWDVMSHMQLPVDIEPEWKPQIPRVFCTGIPGDQGPCSLGFVDFAKANPRSLALTFRSVRAFPTWALTLEVIDDRDGQLRARVCRIPVPRNEVDGECGANAEPECAVSGTVTLHGFPLYDVLYASPNGRIRADFADGGHVEAEF